MNNFTAVARGNTLAFLTAALATSCILVGFTHAVSASPTSNTGELTYYGTGDGTSAPTAAYGSCGMEPHTVGDDFIAVNAPQYDSGSLCGRIINVYGARPTDGKATGVVVDRCGGCKHGDLDTSLSIAQKVCPDIIEKGRCNIKWDFAVGDAEPPAKPESPPTQPETPAKPEPETPAKPEPETPPMQPEPHPQPGPEPQVPLVAEPIPVPPPVTSSAPESIPVPLPSPEPPTTGTVTPSSPRGETETVYPICGTVPHPPAFRRGSMICYSRPAVQY